MKSKQYYYKFWLKSNRGTDEISVRRYSTKPTNETLENDCDDWSHGHGAMQHSDNICHYGWKVLKKLPKNRQVALRQYEKICEEWRQWDSKRRLALAILCIKPFNGQ